MKSFNKTNLIALRAELSTALAAFMANNPEFVLKLGSCRFQETNCTFQLEVSIKDEHGVAQNRERTDYLALAKMYGMKPEWLDQSMAARGGAYQLVGFNAKATKMPVILKRDGKLWKMAVDDVIKIFGGTPRQPGLKNEDISDVINLAENKQ